MFSGFQDHILVNHAHSRVSLKNDLVILNKALTLKYSLGSAWTPIIVEDKAEAISPNNTEIKIANFMLMLWMLRLN